MLQQLDRDTNKWAMKCSAAEVDGKWINVFKDPVTDSGKRSKKGRITLVKDDHGNFRTVTLNAVGDQEDQMVEVFRDGKLLVDYDFDQVRANSNQ